MGQPHTPTARQEWFAARRWGVFIHYLDAVQNASGNYHNTRGYRTGWDECTRELDVRQLAAQLHQAGAGYLVFTLQQGSRFLCAPNALYDALTGLAPGEGTSTRDVIADLLDALAPYDIPLFLYFTGDGPHLDAKAMAGLRADAPPAVPLPALPDAPAPFAAPAQLPAFVRNWCAVLQVYAQRYGSRIAGWWVDGLYAALGYTPQLILPYKQAVRAGNPQALFAANCAGCLHDEYSAEIPGAGRVLMGHFYHCIPPASPLCDYTAGEVVTLDVFPTQRLIDGAQAHILSFLGIPPRPVEVYGGWSARGCKYSSEYLLQYVRQVNALGGVVTLDVCMYRDGHIDADQLRQLRLLGGLRRAG